MPGRARHPTPAIADSGAAAFLAVTGTGDHLSRTVSTTRLYTSSVHSLANHKQTKYLISGFSKDEPVVGKVGKMLIAQIGNEYNPNSTYASR